MAGNCSDLYNCHTFYIIHAGTQCGKWTGQEQKLRVNRSS